MNNGTGVNPDGLVPLESNS